jgi:hypothetical protein
MDRSTWGEREVAEPALAADAPTASLSSGFRARPKVLLPRRNCLKALCNSFAESHEGDAVRQITYLCVSPEGRRGQLPDKLEVWRWPYALWVGS